MNLVDNNGSPVAVELPPEEMLARSITVKCDGQEITPFYATGKSGLVQQRKRTTLMLLDVSGSMNTALPDGRTRFEAARAAAEEFIQGMQAGTDEVAVVPFGSHDVIQLIRSARFASDPESALRDVRMLPSPEPRNNTALFSAVNAGIDVLSEKIRTTPGAEAILLILTDGRNDVRANDDPGLLSGQSGLEIVSAKVRAAGFPIVVVGVGDPELLDENAMKQISTRHQIVRDAGELQREFTTSRVLLQDRVQITFTTPWRDRAALAGRVLPLQVSLTLPDGRTIESETAVWSSPHISAPVYEDRCDAGEMKAALASRDTDGSLQTYLVLRPMLVFLGLGSILIALWFWAPRLIWPDEYIGRDLKVIYSRGRWPSAASHTGDGASSRRAPPGFGTGRHAVHPRKPSDATVVEPKSETGTRTRLELDLPEHRT